MLLPFRSAAALSRLSLLRAVPVGSKLLQIAAEVLTVTPRSDKRFCRFLCPHPRTTVLVLVTHLLPEVELLAVALRKCCCSMVVSAPLAFCQQGSKATVMFRELSLIQAPSSLVKPP